MPGSDKEMDPSKILDELVSFVMGSEEEMEDESIEAVRKRLKERNIDVTSLTAWVNDKLTSAETEAHIEQAGIKRKRLTNLYEESTGQRLRSSLKQEIRDLLTTNPQLAVQYHKFREQPKEDEESLLEDLAFLKKIAKQTKE